MRAAPWGSRIVAYAVDLGIVMVGVFSVMFLAFMEVAKRAASREIDLSPPWSTETDPRALAYLAVAGMISILGFMVFYHGYFIYLEYRLGTTPGKRLFGLRVLSLDGSPINLKQAAGRDFYRYLDCGLIVPAILSMLASERRQRVGDRVYGTWVVIEAGSGPSSGNDSSRKLSSSQ